MSSYLIWGMGLLGTSLGLDLKKRGHRVYGVEKSLEYIEMLQHYEFARIFHTDDASIREILGNCTGIIIGTPVDQVVSILKTLQALPVPESVWITDMASTKGELMNNVTTSFPGMNFIGSHPMAGSDLSGPTNARHDLFAGATIYITPPDNTDLIKTLPHQKITEVIGDFWKELGAHPFTISPAIHDKWAAYLSHGLHLVSCMVSCLLDDIPEVYKLQNPPAGGSFRDITRVAGSNPDLWDGIINSNAKEVSAYLDSLEEMIHIWKDKLSQKKLSVREIFIKSAQIRSAIVKKGNDKNSVSNKEEK